jgi:hypothetical protein
LARAIASLVRLHGRLESTLGSNGLHMRITVPLPGHPA